MTELHTLEILRRPVITEKSTLMADELGHYVFEVATNANKLQIKDAVELVFNVEVAKVRTMVMPAKRGRRGRNWYLRSRQWKKAIITLAPGNTIELFNV